MTPETPVIEVSDLEGYRGDVSSEGGKEGERKLLLDNLWMMPGP